MSYKRLMMLIVLLVALTISVITKTSDFTGVYIGMTLEEYKLNENVYDEDETDLDAIRVGGIKYSIVHYEMTTYCEMNSDGKRTTYKYFTDPFFVIFADDTLYTMGYPYEFKRDTSIHLQMLADELNNFAR